MRQPNPLDPLDDFKRWMESLWPIERVFVWLGLAVVTLALLMFVTR